jgi:hypothetical protein
MGKTATQHRGLICSHGLAFFHWSIELKLINIMIINGIFFFFFRYGDALELRKYLLVCSLFLALKNIIILYLSYFTGLGNFVCTITDPISCIKSTKFFSAQT